MKFGRRLDAGLGRMFKSDGVFSIALSSLVLGTALLLSTIAPLKAAEITIQNGQTETDQDVTISTGDILTILAGGTIIDTQEAILATGNVTIDNAGTVTNTTTDYAIEHSGGMLTLINRATGSITGAFRGVSSANTIASLINAGTITSGGTYGVFANISITSLINSGTITGSVYTGSIDTLINSGTIFDKQGQAAVYLNGALGSLTNSGSIISDSQDGVRASTITGLTNTGTIKGAEDGVQASTIEKLMNTGTITGTSNNGVFVGTLTSLTNSGNITGGIMGVNASNIISLINSGTIKGNTLDGVRATGTIEKLMNTGTITGVINGVQTTTLTSLINTGTITGLTTAGVQTSTIIDLTNSGTITGIQNGVGAITLTNLTNSGTITGGNNGVSATTLTSLTNSGKITGGTNAIRETGAADTLLTLLPGSDISGAIDLGGGTNTLVIGNGLSIDHLFTGTLPQVINSNGAPLFVIGNRVVVVDTTSTLDQQDEQLFDLTNGIWGTVFNNIGDGRNPAAAFANGTIPQYSLGAVPPGETTNSYTNTHMWANVFGNHRIEDGGSSARHNLAGLITGLDGRLNSNVRLGAFFGASQTDIDSIGGQETEIENIFGGLYASYKTDGLTIDLGVTGGMSEHENTRLVDNNQVNGPERVSSSFDGTFIAPELSVSSQYDMGGAIFQPTLRVGYAGMFLDGYTETGASAPLTVGDRDLHLLHARFELAAIMRSKGADSLNFTFSPYVGVEGRSLVGGEAVNVTLLGQNLSFNPGGDDDIASAFAGMRLSVLQTENFGIFAGFEGSVDTDESKTITGNLGLKWLF